MGWRDKLNKVELGHLMIYGIDTIEAFKAFRNNALDMNRIFQKTKCCPKCNSIAEKLGLIKTVKEQQPKATMFKSFPKPKFQIGQEVYVLANRTKEKIKKDISVIIEIRLACLSVVTEVGFSHKADPFIYLVVPKTSMGRSNYQYTSIRESFLAPV